MDHQQQRRINVQYAEDIDPAHPIPLDNFNASKWNSNYYEVGDFQGFLHTSHLSVVAPVTSDKKTQGYVAIHYSNDESLSEPQ